jgi:hypothetical protein
MQAMPDSRQQSFEEIYGPPENFLEIEVGFLLSAALLFFYPSALPFPRPTRSPPEFIPNMLTPPS